MFVFIWKLQRGRWARGYILRAATTNLPFDVW